MVIVMEEETKTRCEICNTIKEGVELLKVSYRDERLMLCERCVAMIKGVQGLHEA